MVPYRLHRSRLISPRGTFPPLFVVRANKLQQYRRVDDHCEKNANDAMPRLPFSTAPRYPFCAPNGK